MSSLIISSPGWQGPFASCILSLPSKMKPISSATTFAISLATGLAMRLTSFSAKTYCMMFQPTRRVTSTPKNDTIRELSSTCVNREFTSAKAATIRATKARYIDFITV